MNLTSLSTHQPMTRTDQPIDYTIRSIRSRKDFQAYFSLRYSVWSQLGYIPFEQDCPRSQLEVDAADRTATAVGMFYNRKLVGCGRLVQSFGRELPYATIKLIEGLLLEHAERTAEVQLVANFKWPVGVNHPYDMLKGFSEFKKFYKVLAESRITHAELGRIIVDPGYRGRQFGERIVVKLLELAQQRKIGVLFLACIAEHQDFYARNGFRSLKSLHCDQFVNVGVPAIAMAKLLNRRARQKLESFF
jgi:predicted GNAT family N-acyltransferase